MGSCISFDNKEPVIKEPLSFINPMYDDSEEYLKELELMDNNEVNNSNGVYYEPWEKI